MELLLSPEMYVGDFDVSLADRGIINPEDFILVGRGLTIGQEAQSCSKNCVIIDKKNSSFHATLLFRGILT